MNVKDVMAKTLIKINKSQKLVDAMELLEHNHISRIPVVEHGGKLVGLLSTDEIYTKLMSNKDLVLDDMLPQALHVSSCMVHEPLVVTPDTELGDVARLMLKEDHYGFPVVDSGELLGIVTKTDVMTGFDFGDLTAGSLLQSPSTISLDESMMSIRRKMEGNKVNTLYVMDDNKLMGVVDEEDLAHAIGLWRKRVNKDTKRVTQMKTLTALDLMTSNLLHAAPSTKVNEVVKLMKAHNLSDVPVLDNGRLVGVVSAKAILKRMAEKA